MQFQLKKASEKRIFYQKQHREILLGYCEHEGERVEKGDGNVRVFPLAIERPPERTPDATLHHAMSAIRSGEKHIFGVKGFTIFSLLPFFNTVEWGYFERAGLL